MFDVQGLPPMYRCDVQRFDAIDATSGAGTWQRWLKPRGTSMVWMMAMGSGSGGGGGLSGADTTQRGGGGGGGSGAIATIMYPGIFVPDLLYVNVGVGGAGSTGTGQPGTSSQRSFIGQVPPHTNLTQSVPTGDGCMLISGANTGGGGGAGTGAAGGAAGGAEGALVVSNVKWLSSGIWQAIVGVTGGAGGLGNNPGGNIAVPTNSHPMVTNGGGGGGCTSADQLGGGLLTGDYLPALGQGTSGVNAGAGPNGMSLGSPLYSCGGAGGAGVTAGTGGAGGRGGIGCGGGGGGAGVTGGVGGQGGNGVVFIITW